jgi:hypothetical protein
VIWLFSFEELEHVTQTDAFVTLIRLQAHVRGEVVAVSRTVGLVEDDAALRAFPQFTRFDRPNGPFGSDVRLGDLAAPPRPG